MDNEAREAIAAVVDNLLLFAGVEEDDVAEALRHELSLMEEDV